MLRQLTQRADLVVGSRYIEGASRRDWTFRRMVESCLVTKPAQRPLRIPICDPMSGYFLMRRDDFLRISNHLDGRGFKILLELASKMRSAMVV
jgi:dolichol-phosphate mannosyltransferase